MTGGQPTSMTVVYVANTGHVLAALTQTNDSGTTPAVADVAGDGLLVRGLLDASAASPSFPPDMFLVPATDLKTQSVAIDTSSAPALVNPRAYGLAVSTGSTSPAPPGTPPAFEPLTPFPGTAPAIDLKKSGKLTLTLNSAPGGAPYYVLVVSLVTDPQATPAVVNSFTGTLPTSATTVTLQTNALVNPQYSVLLLVAAMRPMIASSLTPT
jgi:hypothetical protein